MCRNSHKWDFCPYIIGEIVIEAGQKMGEMLLAIQRQTGNQYKNASSDGIEKAKTKTEITAEMGMTKDQVFQYQQMAQNPEAVPNGITLPKWKSFKRVDYAKKHNFNKSQYNAVGRPLTFLIPLLFMMPLHGVGTQVQTATS